MHPFSPCKVIIMAGGTGGHIYPALALAKALQQHHVEIEWLGTAAGLESRIIPSHGFTLHTLPIRGLRHKGLFSWLRLPLILLHALYQAILIIQHIRPQLVIGFGGYTAAPGGIGAWLTRTPLIIHEQNAKAGLTNRLLRLLATQTFSAFPNAFKNNKHIKTIGNPLRQSLLDYTLTRASCHPREGGNPGFAKRTSIYNGGEGTKQNLLILGGSQGARILNEIVPAALSLIPEKERPTIRHQAGERTLSTAVQNYEQHNIIATVDAYIDDMTAALNWADLVICRAGAMTVSEIALLGKAAIFIPLASAVDNHQYYNCQYLVSADGGVCITEPELTPQSLAKTLSQLLQNDQKRDRMARQAKLRSTPNATQDLLTACLALLPKQTHATSTMERPQEARK